MADQGSFELEGNDSEGTSVDSLRRDSVCATSALLGSSSSISSLGGGGGGGSSDDGRESSYGQASSRCGRAAANYLNSRGIVAVETEYVHDFDSPELCRATYQAFFGLLCPGQHEALFNDSYEALLDVFDQSYVSDIKFSEALLKAFGESIQDLAVAKAKHQFKFRSPVLCSDNVLVLAPKERLVIGDTEYAAGLTRETTLPMDRNTILVDDDSAPRVHAAVVLQRDAAADRNGSMASWNVWVALAVVDLKIQGKGVRGLATNSHTGCVLPLDPLTARWHGPLAQVIVDTAAHALRGTAALGQLPENIPFAVVSCQKTGGSNAEKDESNWVHGNVVVPEVCGFPYAFNVDAYGNLVEGTKLENHSSLAAYLHVMAHGLKLASDWLDAASKAQSPLRKTPAPHRICGRTLHFGTDTPLTRDGTNEALLVLVATPVSKYGKNGLRIAQGELFMAAVNLHKLQASVSGPHTVFWCCDTYDDKETSVLIKVSSMSCFNLMVPSERAYLYGLEDRHWEADAEIRQVLSWSLYGLYVTPGKHGIVQLLPNLAQQRFEILRPERWLFDDTWSALWDAFAGFVTETLLPLAKYGIVHADLRFGYDVTSNVLYNPAAAPGGGSIMRMIDLDSLCKLEDLRALPSVVTTGDDDDDDHHRRADGRTISPRSLPIKLKASALGFVLGQVIGAAEAWLEEIRDADVTANATIARVVAGPSSIAVTIAGAAAVDEPLIGTVLEHYRDEMERTYGARRRRRPEGRTGPQGSGRRS
jgi:hypothetical protein